MSECVLGVDVGTSSVKVIAADGNGQILRRASRSYGLHAASGGVVEQDLGEILAATKAAVRSVVDDVPGGTRSIGAVSVTAQMFNLVAVDRFGSPLLPMLSWLDQRAEHEARSLEIRMPASEQFERLGSVVSAKDILPKILWLRDRRPEIYRSTSKLLDCKEAIVIGLTGAAAIDVAGASAFRLLDLEARQWNLPVCRDLGIAERLLPEVMPATAIAGGVTRAVAGDTGLVAGTPVTVGAGDVPASQIGSGATNAGDVHVSLGTAIYFGVTLAQPTPDPNRMLGVLGHMDPSSWILWLEVATGAGALAWLARAIGALDASRALDSQRIERLVGGCADEMEGLLFAPWLSGERVPVFDDRVRAAFVGISLHHGPPHLLRAVMEGVAFQMRWALDYGLEYGPTLGQLRAVGGGTIGSVWMQIIADILDRSISVIRDSQDAAAMGAAVCGLVAIGLRPDFGFARDLAVIERDFVPDSLRRMDYSVRYREYSQLYDALRPLYHPEVRR